MPKTSLMGPWWDPGLVQGLVEGERDNRVMALSGLHNVM